jgi:hypothetical protein
MQFSNSAACSAVGPTYEVVVLGGWNYCAWPHDGQVLVSPIHDVGDPMPPVDVEYPMPIFYQVNPPSSPNPCINDPNFKQVIGEWRNRTVCEIDVPPIPAANCPLATPSQHGRLRVYPSDFANPSANVVPAPDGTQFCVFQYHHAYWYTTGWRAIRVIEPARTQICVEKYDDRNVNSTRDASEPLLNRWTFVIEDSSGNSFGRMTTHGEGRACRDVRPGMTYTVTETLRPGWNPTDPLTPAGSSPAKTVTVQAGQTANLRFGNCRLQERRPGRRRLEDFRNDPAFRCARIRLAPTGVIGRPPIGTPAPPQRPTDPPR